ncbi:hypothetical protein Pyn_37980 [Prunus yedoensis var. nudiflora]|uniref:Uncharacterized protein n=1 Tax=Prunus yedoensis var. nudiflora TaxID=2094558 RepID=A0A314XU79_PRUYE|nr:hypothetical protein Pyn_37980 [Prunus yedoensis var. nudiflora]
MLTCSSSFSSRSLPPPLLHQLRQIKNLQFVISDSLFASAAKGHYNGGNRNYRGGQNRNYNGGRYNNRFRGGWFKNLGNFNGGYNPYPDHNSNYNGAIFYHQGGDSGGFPAGYNAQGGYNSDGFQGGYNGFGFHSSGPSNDGGGYHPGSYNGGYNSPA